MTGILQAVIFGLLVGGVYALFASGLTLAFGVMRIVNLAHAAFIVAAAYVAFFAFDKLGIDPLLSILFIAPLFFFIGVVVYLLLFTRIEGTARYVEMTVLLTFAVAILIEGTLGWQFTGVYRQARTSYLTDAFHIGDFLIPTGQFIAAVLSFILLFLLWLFLRYTRTGYGIRATMQNRAAAQLVGVNVRKVSAISFGISIALAGASGALVSYLFAFYPFRHWQWIAILLALVVLGGMGSLKGALIGALALGVASALVVDQIGPGWGPMAFYAALFGILLVRPRGLFGKELSA
jgi:branched-chain amino acid transport system permease protein